MYKRLSFLPSFAFDFGTHTSTIVGPLQETVFSEPSVIVLNEAKAPFLYGEQAVEASIALENDEHTVVHCIDAGHCTNEEALIFLVLHWKERLELARWKKSLPMRAVIPTRASFAPVDKNTLSRVLKRAGFLPIFVPASVCALLYEKHRLTGKPQCVIDCGASECDMSIVSVGTVTHKKTFPLGGRDLDRLIQLHLFKTKSVLFPIEHIEKLKLFLGRKSVNSTHTKVLRGKHSHSGQVVSLQLHITDIAEPIAFFVQSMLQALQDFYSDLPVELISELTQESIVMCGGLSQFYPLSFAIEKGMQMETTLIARPTYAQALGAHMTLRKNVLLEADTL